MQRGECARTGARTARAARGPRPEQHPPASSEETRRAWAELAGAWRGRREASPTPGPLTKSCVTLGGVLLPHLSNRGCEDRSHTAGTSWDQERHSRVLSKHGSEDRRVRTGGRPLPAVCKARIKHGETPKVSNHVTHISKEKPNSLEFKEVIQEN